jgi:hypothetical protein
VLHDRIPLYSELESRRDSKVLVYVTGDKPGLETQIAQDAIDFFIDHLDKIGVVKKISLLLYTRGGDTLAAWSIVNLIRLFCDEFEVIIPHKAHSAGTLISLGANTLVMTKQATLGPIDPSVNNALNPQVPGAGINAKVPVSVEAVKGFLELAKDELDIKDEGSLAQVLIKLADMVHPLVLGQVYRTRAQIQMLAERLLKTQINDQDQIKRIIAFLCSDSGSHDYTINRREAIDHLGLNVEKPDDQLYDIIKGIYENIKHELQFNTHFDPNSYLGADPNKAYDHRRVIIESLTGGTDVFVTEGMLTKVPVPVQGSPGVMQQGIRDDRLFEGWRHENA